MKSKEGKKVAYYTLGCKLNFSETSTIARDLSQNGYRTVNFSEQADLYVINTCSVTSIADRKCRKVVNKVIRQSPNALVAVVGCYAQLKPGEISNIPGVDIVLGVNEKFKITEYLDSLEKKDKCQVYCCDIEESDSFIPSYSIEERTRTFLKIQDGCSYNCSYCTIPLARGISRSDTIKSCVDTARYIANTDIREIVLTGVNIGDFGNGTEETFLDLIQELDKINGIDRFRISSIEPNLLSDEIIEFVAASNKFVHHFHIPLQSGSNKILRLMRRRYPKELFVDRVHKIRELMKNSSIGADVIVGFPGENEKEFMTTYKFINELDISYLHVFSYSKRQNTDALQIDHAVQYKEKKKRSKMLNILSGKKRRQFYLNNINNTQPVLFETYKNGMLTGFTDNYIRVKVFGEKSFVNTVVNTKLISLDTDYILGEFIN